MPRFLTIGYGDQAGYDATPAPLRDAAHAHDARLLGSGAEIGRLAGPVQVRNFHGEGTVIAPGAFLTSALPVAGFALLEADSLEAAIALVSQSPCAVAGGVVEVWSIPE